MITKFIQNWKKQKSFKIWFLLLLWTFVSLLLSNLINFIPEMYVNDLEHLQEYWQSSHYMFYKVSFHSNVFAFLISLLTVLSIIKKKCIHIHRFKILTFSTLIVVFLVFWFYLFVLRVERTGYNITTFTTTFIMHAIVPLLYVFVFIYEMKTEKIFIKLNNKKDFLLILIYPFLYIIFAIIIYYGYGAKSNDAIYSFLRFEYQSITTSIASSFATIFIFSVVTFITINFINKVSKNNLKKI